MATLDETVTGAGDITGFSASADNLSIVVLDFGTARPLDLTGVPRRIDVGWWAALAIYDVFGDGDQIYAGHPHFIFFERQAFQLREFDVADFHGVRYNLHPGVEVRFFIP
jgi:hypothetical protein